MKAGNNLPVKAQGAMKEENRTTPTEDTGVMESLNSEMQTPQFADASREETAIGDSSSPAPEAGTQNYSSWQLQFLVNTTAHRRAAHLRAMGANTYNQAAAGARGATPQVFSSNVGAQANASLTATRPNTRARAYGRPQAPSTSNKAAAPLVIYDSSWPEGDERTGWYHQAIASFFWHVQMMNDQKEQPELHGTSSSLHLPGRSEASMEAERRGKRPAAEEEDARELLTLEDYCKMWGLNPSEFEPDEAGPSEKRKCRVPPLADDEVAKFDCGICMETLPVFDVFHGMQCQHRFCVQCMTTYIEGRIRDGGAAAILCPDPACKGESNGVLHPELCKKSIDYATFCSWGDRLTEEAILREQRVYCPNRRCRLMLERAAMARDKAACKAACPACKHLMCTKCGAEWFMEGRKRHNCDDAREAQLVRELAAEHRWKQCPSCEMLIERTVGCDAMVCRCGCAFCYSCGHRREPGPNGVERCQCHTMAAYVRRRRPLPRHATPTTTLTLGDLPPPRPTQPTTAIASEPWPEWPMPTTTIIPGPESVWPMYNHPTTAAASTPWSEWPPTPTHPTTSTNPVLWQQWPMSNDRSKDAWKGNRHAPGV